MREPTKIYRLSKAAGEDMEEIFLSGAALFGYDEATDYIIRMKASFAFLAEYPFAARLRSEITPPVRIHRFRSHLIFYEAADNGQIIILRIRYGREDWASDPV